MDPSRQEPCEWKVGVFLPMMSGMFFGRVVKDLLQTAKDCGIRLEFFVGDFCPPGSQEAFEDPVFRLAETASLDALLVVNSLTVPCGCSEKGVWEKRFPRLSRLPLYSLFSPMENAFSVCVDEEKAVGQMIRHLVTDHGYRNFVLACGKSDCVNCRFRRFQLIKEHLAEAGLSLPEKQIFRGLLSEGRLKNAMFETLFADRSDFPDVIISMNEEADFTVQEILNTMGISIPEDVALVSFGDGEENISHNLSRSTVDYPVWEVVSFAMHRIASDLSGDTGFSPARHNFRAAFMVRKSCGCSRPLSSVVDDPAGMPLIDAITGKKDGGNRFFSGDLQKTAVFRRTLDLVAEECVSKGDMTDLGALMKNTIAALQETSGISSDFMDAFSTQWIITLLRHPDSREQMLINAAFIDANRLLFKMEQDISLEIKKADKGLLDFYRCCNEVMARHDSLIYALKEIGSFLPYLGFSYLYLFLDESRTNQFRVEYRLGFEKDKMLFVPEHDFSVFSTDRDEGNFLNAMQTINFSGENRKNSAVYSVSQNGENFGFLVFSVDEKYFATFGKIRHLLSHAIFSLLSRQNIERELTNLKHRNLELSKLSQIDAFTRMGNRRALLEKGLELFRMAHEAKRSVGVIFLDLDGLKKINDTYGHAEGDKAILAFAEILRSCFRKTDLLVRYGGDEFVVVVSGLQEDAMQRSMDRIAGQIAAFNAQTEKQWELSASWGSAFFDPLSGEEPSPTFEKMLHLSDSRLYEIKKKKKENARKEEEGAEAGLFQPASAEKTKESGSPDGNVQTMTTELSASP